jgi:hypothetical protein
MSVVGAIQAEEESVWKIPVGAVDDPDRAPERSGSLLAEEAVEENCQFPRTRLLDVPLPFAEQPESRAEAARAKLVHSAMQHVRLWKGITNS